MGALWNACWHKLDSDSQKAGELFGFELGILDWELAVLSLFFVLDVELFCRPRFVLLPVCLDIFLQQIRKLIRLSLWEFDWGSEL